jgi:hypothetical protein
VAVPRQSACITPQARDVRCDIRAFHQHITAPDSLGVDVPDLAESAAGLVAGFLKQVPKA